MALLSIGMAGAGETVPDLMALWDYPVPEGTHPPQSGIVKLLPGHPRLVFREGGRTFDYVRRLWREDAVFGAIMERALAMKPSAQHPAANAACWIVSQNDAFAEAAIATMLRRPPNKSGEPSYSRVWSHALAYDWLYHHPLMTPSARERIEAAILERIGTELDDLDGMGMALWHGRSQAANGVMIAALAVGDLPGQETMLRRATAHYAESLRALQFSEGWPEGASYWIYNRAGPYGFGADCVMSATGSDMIEGIPIREVMRRIGYWSLYQYGPNGVFEPYGDSSGSLRLGHTGWWVLTVDHYAKLSRDPGLAAGADYLRNRSPDPYGSRPYYWNAVVTYEPAVRPAEPYDPAEPEAWMRGALPQAMLFGRASMGVAFFRGRWGDPNELYASFKAGDFLAHHDHYDTGTFTLQYGADLVTRSGHYADYTGAHRIGYQAQTVAANSILVLAPGETGAYLRRRWPERAWLAGGQRVIRPTSFSCVNRAHFEAQRHAGSHLARAEIKAWDSVPGLQDYVAADITAAYNSTHWAEPGSEAKVALVTRRFLYLRPERAFVILDHVETTNPRYLPKFVLHGVNKPKSDTEAVLVGEADNGILSTHDRLLTFENNGARVAQHVLLPERARSLKLGGPDYCFYVEADGDQADGFDGVNVTEGARPKGRRMRGRDGWRIEVEPTEAGIATVFLNVLLPRPPGETAPLPDARMLDGAADTVRLQVGATRIQFAGELDQLPLIER